MALTETKILREDWEVGPRLAELRTDKERLLRARAMAVGAAADATPFHPSNAAGTFSYQHGTFALRNEHVGNNGWHLDRPNGVEAITNAAIRTRIVFANVDVACNDEHNPKARSEKGSGAERLCAGNILFDFLPRYACTAERSGEGWKTYYLMVSADGAAELSRALIERGRFTNFAERLYLSDGSDLDAEPKLLDSDETIDEFDPQIARK